ncbi:alginate biosynthesis protein AlgX [Metapseudomonas resinovorans]|uniref:Alginate biosynthesis protein AlgX n=1 Tax=Metapseudomonas resinovorans NBRC 106553 TaxID=1245471 RepID=S6BK25_METRE|nr:alginate biosynthesis protein AlgX [Pseudomonas resinovorans]BAN49549.1 alginate biosynthesis protein AlgX [Pseudomonas resinovorans NBRC 106553]
MNRATYLIAATLLVAASDLRAAPPTYQAEACCSLCPAAASLDPSLPGLAGLGGLVEARDGWLFSRAQDLRSQFGLDDYSYKQLERLRNALKHNGTELLVVYPPSRGLIHGDKLQPADRARFDQAQARENYRATLARLRKLDIWVPDLASLLEAQAGTPDYYFKGDQHWTPQGAERTARLVAETARGIPALAQLPHGAYASQPAGLVGRSGSLQKAAQMACGTGYPRQFVQGYVTRPLEPEAAVEADVVLVGSSNSADAFNFAGFLEQYLGTPVRNASLASGGHTSALMQYLMSADYRKKSPKLLVWELDDADSLMQRNFYRQAIAAVGDGCSGQPALLQGRTGLAGGSRQVLFNGADGVLPIRGSDYRIELQLEAPDVQQLGATLTFMNGRQENLLFERGTGPGRFLLELREDADWDDLTFLALSVQAMPGGSQGELSARLCKARSDQARPELRTAQAGAGS